MDKSLLSDATSSDDSPPPGYLLNDISRATVTSYPASTQALEYLIARLAKTNPNIKYKSLIVIKHICRTGRAEFKRDIAKHVDAIKECLQFRGPPDPLRGDEYYRRVRDTAKETLDAIFDGQVPMSTSAVAAANRIQGIGGGEEMPSSKPSSSSSGIFSSVSSTFSNLRSGGAEETPYQGHPGATGGFGNAGPMAGSSASSSYVGPSTNTTATQGSSTAFVGIGNPNFKDARDDKSWYQRAAAVASSANISVPSLGISFQGDKKGLMEEDYSNSYISNRGNNAVGSNDSYNGTFNNPTKNAIASNASMGSSIYGPKPVPMTSTTGNVVPNFPTSSVGTGRVGAAASDGLYERSLIQGLCEPSGLKPVPPEDKLKSFLLTVNTLSPDVVGSCLIDVLNSDSWQSRVKGLIVIAKTVKASNSHMQWWKSNAVEELSMLSTSDSKVAVRTQAVKTLSSMGIAAAAPPPVPGAASQISTDKYYGNATGNLIDDDDDTNLSTNGSIGQLSPVASGVTTPTYRSPQQGSQRDINSATNIFAGLDLNDRPVSVPSTNVSEQNIAPSSTFDFLSGSTTSAVNIPRDNQSAPAPPVPKSNFSAFDDLTDLSPPQLPLPSTAIPQSAPPTNAFDFLSNSSPVNTSTTQSSSQNGNLFGNMSVNGSAVPNPPYISPPSSNTSTASTFQQDLLSLSTPSYPQQQQQQQQQMYPGHQQMHQAMPSQNVYYQQQQQPPNPMMMGQYNGGMPAANMSTGFNFIAQPPPRPQYQPQGYAAPPAMNINLATRKDIPDQASMNGGTGFSFMGGAATPNKQADSFGFVSDAMKAETKK